MTLIARRIEVPTSSLQHLQTIEIEKHLRQRVAPNRETSPTHRKDNTDEQ